MLTKTEKLNLKSKLLSDSEINNIESYDENSGIIDFKDGIKRRITSIFTRCMGYFRPIDDYNKGKKSEFKERKWFKEDKIKGDGNG